MVNFLICWFCAERLTEVNNVLGMRCQEQEIEQNIFCKLHPILCGTTTSDQDRNINLSLSLAFHCREAKLLKMDVYVKLRLAIEYIRNVCGVVLEHAMARSLQGNNKYNHWCLTIWHCLHPTAQIIALLYQIVRNIRALCLEKTWLKWPENN